MVLVDANVIIRIIETSNKEMTEKAVEFLMTTKSLARNEVLAEVFYVLNKVYQIKKESIGIFLLKCIEKNLFEVESVKIVEYAISKCVSSNLDFVDCLLYAYNQVDGAQVFTFDKALNKLIRG